MSPFNLYLNSIWSINCHCYEIIIILIDVLTVKCEISFIILFVCENSSYCVCLFVSLFVPLLYLLCTPCIIVCPCALYLFHSFCMLSEAHLYRLCLFGATVPVILTNTVKLLLQTVKCNYT